MSVHIVDAMLPGDQGKINKLLLHEGILNLHLMQICILIIICVFNMNAGDIIFFHLLTTKMPVILFTAMARRDRHAIPLERY